MTMNARNNWSLFYHKKKKNTHRTLLSIDQSLWNYVFIFLSINKISYYEIFHFTKIENCISIIQKRDHFNTRSWKRAIDRSIDHFCGDDEVNWNEEKSAGRKPREEEKKEREREKKRSASNYSCTTDRWKKNSLLVPCLSLPLRKKKLILFLRVNDQIALDISPPHI